jgi:long-chain acyl-CoA synthetase
LAQCHGDLLALDQAHGPAPERFTFNQLHQLIGTVAASFQKLGVSTADVVALFAENGPRWLGVDQGLMRVGAAAAVRGSQAPLPELEFILADCQAMALVLEDSTLLLPLAKADALKNIAFVLLLYGEPPDRQELPLPRIYGWPEFLELAAGIRCEEPFPATPEQLATVLYTSGTTGRPKGVPLSQANLLHQIRSLGVAVNPKPGDRVLSVLPIWHAYERSAGYLLLSRACSQSYTNLRQFRSDLQRVKPHYMISVPRLWEAIHGGFFTALEAMPPLRRRLLALALAIAQIHVDSWRCYANLLEIPQQPLWRFWGLVNAALSWPLARLAALLFWPALCRGLVGGSLRTAISGGGALPKHIDRFFAAIGIQLLVGYGLTETSPVLTCRRPWANRSGSAGRPLQGTELRIVDSESRVALGQRPILNWGEKGLVIARGPQVMGGYLRRPDATAAVLDQEGWFDTGDLGLLLADGSLFLTGRAKDTIVLSSGENIEPGPLEAELVASELVEQVMVVGQDRRQLAALLVPKEEALRAFALEAGLTTANPLYEQALTRALTSAFNKRLAARPGARPEERLAGVALVQPFSIENGLLTQTLKQKRDRITERDATAIDQIYSG